MRLIDAEQLIEHAARERLDTRERILAMIEGFPTANDSEKKQLQQQCNDMYSINDRLSDQLAEERQMTKNIIDITLNFQKLLLRK